MGTRGKKEDPVNKLKIEEATQSILDDIEKKTLRDRSVISWKELYKRLGKKIPLPGTVNEVHWKRDWRYIDVKKVNLKFEDWGSSVRLNPTGDRKDANLLITTEKTTGNKITIDRAVKGARCLVRSEDLLLGLSTALDLPKPYRKQLIKKAEGIFGMAKTNLIGLIASMPREYLPKYESERIIAALREIVSIDEKEEDD